MVLCCPFGVTYVIKQLRNKALQEMMLGIRAKYGKNAILKGVNYEEAATGRERNTQIGGHLGGKSDYQNTNASKDEGKAIYDV